MCLFFLATLMFVLALKRGMCDQLTKDVTKLNGRVWG